MSDLTISIITDSVTTRLNHIKGCHNIKIEIEIVKYMIKKGGNMTTREIADACDLSIYSARRWLMRLEKKGVIKSQASKRIIRWSLWPG